MTQTSNTDKSHVPYLISTQPDGALPDMTDFLLERVGSVNGGWCTSSTLKAGRALAEGEVLSAFVIDRVDGDIRRVDYSVPKAQCPAKQWPKAFADHLAAAGEPMTAGSWSTDNVFSTAAEPLRLWSPARYRAFSNAPFAANLVQALACDDAFDLSAGGTLCLQVRDLTSQTLYEQHFFTATAEQAGTNWSEALCQQVNRDSQVLRAGVLDACTVTPAQSGNAFWVPQCAELCVTLTEAHWWQSQTIEGRQALEEAQPVQAWVYDGFSHRLLAHHQWTPTKAQCTSGKWLDAWATALNASPVSAFLRASTHSPQEDQADEADNLSLWQRGDALRIFTTLPDAAGRQAGPRLSSAWRADAGHAVLITIRHPFSHKLLHRALFKPEDTGKVSDRASWLQALADFLRTRAWPELRVDASDEPLTVPRFSELQVHLENVGDGKSWSDDDYVKYLFENDDWPGRQNAEQARFKLAAGDGTVQVDIQALSGELEFRLNEAAYDKGYRVAACVPRAGEQRLWPVEVTDTKVTWAGPIDEAVYDLYLTYPEPARDNTTLTVGHIGALHPSRFWHDVQAVEFTPPPAMDGYEAISFLCEDYGNTNHSEVFDTSNHDHTGVDERSGLFHAHYPIATLQGLRGLGPVCDLTLHYSALRGNEAGLGDGWAWRFSSIITSSVQEVDHRLLTLAEGTPVVFSAEQWSQLGAGRAVKTPSCRVTSNKEYTTFTVEYPSGRQEILSKPSAPGSDEVEPNEAFRKKVLDALKAIKNRSKPDFPKVPSHWTQWALMVLTPSGYTGAAIGDYEEALSAWSGHANTQELDRRIAMYERPFVQLLPSRIVSQYGEALDLQWKRQNGQFLLMSIKSGESELFSAQYINPEAKTDSQVKMQLWSGSPEAFEIELTLEHYLLRTLKRVQKGAVLQQVECGYDDDPTLDRVLCRLQEQDGSVECVQYVKQDALLKNSPALPRVALHALLPGAGQQNHIDRYTYIGSYQHPDDQMFIVAVQSGSHVEIVHDLHAFGLDAEGNRTPLLQGSGSAQMHWLEFSLGDAHTRTTFRYTGWGDELVEIIENIVIKLTWNRIEISANASPTERKTAVLHLLWRYSTRYRKQLARAIDHLLSLSPQTQRARLGKTVDATTVVTNAQGNPLRLQVKGSHSIHYSYYGAQTQNQIALSGVQALSTVPKLECPFVPAYASAPLMAEYQCDGHGNPQGLKLYGYRKATRAGRDYLELAEVVVIEGLRGTLFADTLDESTKWKLIGKNALWHQISTLASAPASKKTPSEQSKVWEWSITSKQTTHAHDQRLELTNVQTFIDNPTLPGIQVIVSATTAAGTAQVSKEVRSRHSRRTLEKIENGLETHWERDASGRVTKETRYPLPSATDIKTAGRVMDTQTTSVFSADGRQVERTHKDGSQTYSHLDGLQRSWRTAWRRAATEVYVPMEEFFFSGLDVSSPSESWAWDYLPGGQAVRKCKSMPVSRGAQPLLAQSSSSLTPHTDAAEPDTLTALRYPDDYVDPAPGEEELPEDFVDQVLDMLAETNTDSPLEQIESDWGDVTGHVNTLGLVYLNICSILPKHGVTVSDHFQLMKQIQSIIGLEGNEGVKDAITRFVRPMGDIYENPFSHSLKFPTVDDLSNLVGTSDPLDLFELFTKYGRPFNRRALESYLKFTGEPSVSLSTTNEPPVRLTEQLSIGARALSKRTTTSTAKTNGTFQHSVQWADGADQQQLQVDEHYDTDGRVISHTRALGNQTQAYTLERDVLGRVTKVIRPDATTIERVYQGFSNRVHSLSVDGKVVATQTISPVGTLTTRKIGSREYRFDEQAITLPDKTKLQRVIDDKGARLEVDGKALYSQTHADGSTVLNAAPDSQASTAWLHTIATARVPGRRQITEKTPRGTIKTAEWQSLRGQQVAALRADGCMRRTFLDGEGRLLRSCQAHEDVLYRHDELGRLQSRQAHALTGAGQWQVNSEHDGFDREVVRTFLRNGAPCFSQHMNWRGDGRLASKASYQLGKLLRTERFTYDLLDRLESYACDAATAALCPQDRNGTPIKAQTFSWDSLDNLTRCISTPFQGEAVTQTFNYETPSDPTRLTSVSNGTQKTSLTWNSNGQLQMDVQNRALTYTGAGQLGSIKNDEGTLLTRYEYDGLQRLAAQYDEQQQTTQEMRYDGDELIGQVCFDKTGKATGSLHISPGLAQYDGDQVRWLIDDPQAGIVGQVCDTDLQLAPLLPFGEGAVLKDLVSGYNGMRRDPVTGHYHAGNGYRCYDPTLRRYAQPDWLSPFGEGGINDYAHCPDPVNLHDPSGAIMLSRWGQDQELANYAQVLREIKPMPVGGRWRGLALSAALTVVGIAASVMTGGATSVFFIAMTICAVLSFGFEVASVLTEDVNPELSRKLGYASLAFGVLSLYESALGLIKKVPSLIKGAMRSARQFGKRLLRLKPGTRLSHSAVRPMEYARQQLGSLAPANSARPGALATVKAAGQKIIDYLAEAPHMSLNNPRYARMGLYGKMLRQAHRLNNFATGSRKLSAGAWILGKSIEVNLTRGSIDALIAMTLDDASGPITPWGRYSVPLNDQYRWNHGGGGHLLA
ncbi:RHS repeat-associated core domain-containing protein [Pseudomonas parafulva]|uniref:RHS repeat-associated core domain-containing protein n=1 Tax=Pseudomonas parafulva TaxID=157782 RepID=UPI0035621AFB